MKTKQSVVSLLVLALVMAGCATVPLGPTVSVMPAPGKPFDMFMQESRECKTWATNEMGGQEAMDKTLQDTAAGSIIGGMIGAAFGAIIGGVVGDPGRGAAIGAAAGGLSGTASGAGSTANAQAVLQARYNQAYMQCMYAKGNLVPGQAPAAPASPPPPPVSEQPQ